MVKHLDIIITGKVQGVGFRFSTKAVADQLGVKGFIKNESNGNVVIAAEGDDISLDMFLDWCNEGTEDAIVNSVQTSTGELKNYRNFELVKKGF